MYSNHRLWCKWILCFGKNLQRKLWIIMHFLSRHLQWLFCLWPNKCCWFTSMHKLRKWIRDVPFRPRLMCWRIPSIWTNLYFRLIRICSKQCLVLWFLWRHLYRLWRLCWWWWKRLSFNLQLMCYRLHFYNRRHHRLHNMHIDPNMLSRIICNHSWLLNKRSRLWTMWRKLSFLLSKRHLRCNYLHLWHMCKWIYWIWHSSLHNLNRFNCNFKLNRIPSNSMQYWILCFPWWFSSLLLHVQRRLFSLSWKCSWWLLRSLRHMFNRFHYNKRSLWRTMWWRYLLELWVRRMWFLWFLMCKL